MKQILKVIIWSILMFISISKIYAITYEYSEWSEEYPEGINEMLIEKEIRYRWYFEQRYNEEYLRKSEGRQKYIDEEDTQETTIEYYEYPVLKEGDELSTREEEFDVISNETTHVVIKAPFYQNSYISEIEVFDKGTNSNIEYSIEEPNDIYYDYINNKDKTDFNLVVDNDDIYLNLKDKYILKNLKVTVYYKNLSNATESMEVGFSKDMYLVMEKESQNLEECLDSCSQVFEIENAKNRYRVSVNIYKVKTTKYKKYDIRRVYYNSYEKEKAGFIKDENDYKTFYRYITSDQVISDGHGNVVKDENYCIKNFCYFMEFENNVPKKEIENPKTEDNIDKKIINMSISVINIIFTIILLLIIKFYYKKKHLNLNKSSFVESI